jgi:hypothetical protein
VDTGAPIAGVRIKPKHITAAYLGVTCPETTTDSNGDYRFTADESKSFCLTFSGASIDYIAPEGYRDGIGAVGSAFDKLIPTMSLERIGGATPSGSLRVNGVTNSSEVMAGSPVTFTVSNAVSGQIHACYQVLHHPNFPDDRSLNVPEPTPCTVWTEANWTGSDEWHFDASNNTLVGTFSPTAVDEEGNTKWNIHNLKVRSSFRKSGTNEVVTAMMTVSAPASGTTKAGVVGTIRDIGSGIVDGTRNIIRSVAGGIGSAVSSFIGWVGSFFSTNNEMIQVLNLNTATVVDSGWDGYATKSISGSGHTDFTYYPPTSGDAQVKGIHWSWTKTGEGQTSGKNAYVWLTDQNDILISGDPNRALGVASGALNSTKLTSGDKYRLHYVFPQGLQFNLSGAQRSPDLPLWNAFDTIISYPIIGRTAFVWNSDLACSDSDGVKFTWSKLDGTSDASAKVWVTQHGNVVAGDPNTTQPGVLEASGLQDGGQYVLEYTMPEGEFLSITGAVLPSSDGCPAPPANMLSVTLPAQGGVLQQRQASGQIVSFPMPGTSQYNSVNVIFGENPGSPLPQPIEISVSKCPGEINSFDGTNFCNATSQNGAFTRVVSMFSPYSIITDAASATRYGYCWAPDGAQYYVNARWTYGGCPGGASKCGFNISWQRGPW